MDYKNVRSATLLAGSLIIGSAIGANAATETCTGGSGGSATTYSLSDAIDSACFNGNDTNTIDSTFELFGMTGWILADKTDSGSAGDQSITFTGGPENGDDSGTWDISSVDGVSKVAITLKAGNNFGAFLLDLEDDTPLSGLWEASKNLSHASIYYNNMPSVSEIPLPATLPLFFAALGGLAFVARKRSA